MKTSKRTNLNRTHKKLSRMAKNPLHVSLVAMAPIVVGVIVITSYPQNMQLQNTIAAKSTSPTLTAKASSVAPHTIAQSATQVTVPASNVGTVSNQIASPPLTTARQSAKPTTSKSTNTGLQYPLPGIPTVSTIKMDYTNSSTAHFLTIYSYNLMVGTFEFIVHPVHSRHFTSDFYVPGYLNTVFSNVNAEPDQQANGNPQLNSWDLSDGDIYTLSVCSYDTGSCGVVSSNSVTLTVSVSYVSGFENVTYNYSQ